jgi:hypothetical protein
VPSPPQVFDDDAVIVPAPDLASIASSRRLAQPTSSPTSPTLFFRRTMIPILLTCGTIFAALAAIWLRLDPDSPPRAGTGAWLPLTFAAIALTLLAFAVLNMMQVRHLLRPARRWARVDGPSPDS